MPKYERFWDFVNKEDGAELLIHGDISNRSWLGDEVTPKIFKQELDKCRGDLDIFINSGGGDVFAGMAIYNMLTRYEGKKTVHIDGLAASIASVIAMAGDEVIMPENAMIMIHNAWTICRGNRNDLRKVADEVEKIDGLIADTYARRGNKTGAEYAAMMDAETWFTAQEAKEAGLIDTIEAGKQIAASMDGDFLCASGIRIDIARYRHADAVRQMTDHSNGGGSQPVDDDKQSALDMQRRKFNESKLKIAERMN